MAYTTIDDPGLYFNTLLYAGSASTWVAHTGVGFSPDMTWHKSRTSTGWHGIADRVRGVDADPGCKAIYSNSTSAEENNTSEYLDGYQSDGFTTGVNGSFGAPSQNYVAWCWKVGGSPSSNSNGAIATSRSLSTTAGFSIMKYTGSGSGSNIAHGLGATPDLIIRKNISGTEDWYVHSILIDGSHDYLKLNTTDAKADSGLTASTSTLIYTAADSADHIVYAFKSIQGFSKFGSYLGNNNADGKFIYTGFKPAFLMVKCSSHASSNWVILDNKRSSSGGGNPNDKWQYANTTDAEVDQSSNPTDFLSNGIKMRNNGGYLNASGRTYIYMAFAEAPFVNSNGVPCNAR